MNLSNAMQQLIIRLLDNPEALGAFIDAGGLEMAVQKLIACHKVTFSNNNNYLFSNIIQVRLTHYNFLIDDFLNFLTTLNYLTYKFFKFLAIIFFFAILSL